MYYDLIKYIANLMDFRDKSLKILLYSPNMYLVSVVNCFRFLFFFLAVVRFICVNHAHFVILLIYFTTYVLYLQIITHINQPHLLRLRNEYTFTSLLFVRRIQTNFSLKRTFQRKYVTTTTFQIGKRIKRRQMYKVKCY